MKTEFKGTKGKWIYNFNGQYCDVFNENRFDNADKIMSISTMLYDRQHNDVNDTDENKANAKLIASAPELLNSFISAIILLKQTTEFEVLESYRIKVLEFEKVLEKALT